jgi:hypothetical protein
VTPEANVYQEYNYHFVAVSSTTDLTFLMRDDPYNIALDTISVRLAADPLQSNLLVNGGLDAAPNATSGGAPAGWAVVGTQGLNFAGTWRSAAPGTTVNNTQAGSGYWYDGSVGGHDGIAQSIATIAGDTHDLSFWLASTTVPNGGSIDIQVFGGALLSNVSVTSGTLNDMTEPVSTSVFGTGLVGPVHPPSARSDRRHPTHRSGTPYLGHRGTLRPCRPLRRNASSVKSANSPPNSKKSSSARLLMPWRWMSSAGSGARSTVTS